MKCENGRSLRPIEAIFASQYRRRTILNSLYVLVSIIGLWAGSVYIPAGVIEIAGREGLPGSLAAQYASYATMLLGIGTIIGCALLPPLAERIGRLKCMAVFFFIMLVSIAVGFGPAFYLKQHALAWFFVIVFLLGIGGANFAMYTLWVPEQYPTGGFAEVPSRSTPRWAASWARDLRFWWARGWRITAPSEFPCRSPPSPS